MPGVDYAAACEECQVDYGDGPMVRDKATGTLGVLPSLYLALSRDRLRIPKLSGGRTPAQDPV